MTDRMLDEVQARLQARSKNASSDFAAFLELRRQLAEERGHSRSLADRLDIIKLARQEPS